MVSVPIHMTAEAKALIERKAKRRGETTSGFLRSLINEAWRARSERALAVKRGKEALASGEEIEVTVETTFRGPLATTLLEEAARRNKAPVTLLADIVQTVLGENLVTPVLDDMQPERTGA